MEEIKLCKDCKFSKKNLFKDEYGHKWMCHSPMISCDLVTGKIKNYCCITFRESGERFCTKAGLWFEKKLTLSEKIKVWFMKEVK